MTGSVAGRTLYGKRFSRSCGRVGGLYVACRFSVRAAPIPGVRTKLRGILDPTHGAAAILSIAMPHPEPERLIADAAWLRRLAGQPGGDASLAEDVQQEVELATLLRPERRDRPWLAALARNLTITQWRRRKAEDRRVSALPPADSAVPAADLAAEAELQQLAVAAVLELPETYRDTILRRFMEGLSVLETAQAMAVPVDTVRTRQKRALAMLRARLLPKTERRGWATVIASIATWTTVVNTKKMAVAGVALLFALLYFQPWLPEAVDQLVPASKPVAGQARADAPTEAALAQEQASERESRLRTPVANPTSATLTVRAIWQETGAPAVGMQLLCYAENSKVGKKARTDERGLVEFADLQPGEHFVATLLGSERATLAAGEHRSLDLELESGKTEAGIVVDLADVPVAGAEILACFRGVEPQRTYVMGTSDIEGRFSVAGVPLYAALGARHPALGTSDFRLLLGSPSQGPPTTTLRLPGVTRRVSGRVVDRHGQPVAGAWVRVGESIPAVRRDAMASGLVVMQRPPATLVESSTDGSFSMEGLQAHAQPLLVCRDGLAAHRETLELEFGDAANLQIVLRRGGVLIGTVRDEAGLLLADVAVHRVGATYPEPWSTATNASGEFRFEGLPVGEVEILIHPGSKQSVHRAFTFTAAETQRTEITLLDESRIRGRLVDLDGVALVGWRVALVGGEEMTTDSAGAFACKVAGGDHTLTVRNATSEHEVVRYLGVVASADEQTMVIATARSGGIRLRGRVVDPDGRPLAGVEVFARQGDAQVLELRGSSAVDGTFLLGALAPGKAELIAKHDELVFAPMSIAMRAGEPHDVGEIRAVRPASLQVRLIGSKFVLSHARIELIAGELHRKTLDSGPVRTIAKILPGRYQLVIRVDGTERQRIEVELGAGERKQHDVVLR